MNAQPMRHVIPKYYGKKEHQQQHYKEIADAQKVEVFINFKVSIRFYVRAVSKRKKKTISYYNIKIVLNIFFNARVLCVYM